MQQSAQITFHNLPHSDAVEADVRARLDKLEQVFDRLISARVVIDSPHRNQTKGKTYEVKIELNAPGAEIVIAREPVGDLHKAIADAFDTARRRLKEHAEKQRRG